jgi:hypothetical protein
VFSHPDAVRAVALVDERGGPESFTSLDETGIIQHAVGHQAAIRLLP